MRAYLGNAVDVCRPTETSSPIVKFGLSIDQKGRRDETIDLTAIFPGSQIIPQINPSQVTVRVQSASSTIVNKRNHQSRTPS